MELFYTVISREGTVQSKPSQSLGGFKSSSKVPNSSFDALFGEVSSYGLQNPTNEYIGLVLQNTMGRKLKDLRMWMESPEGTLCKFKLAVVELTPAGEMETVPSVNSKPLYAEFYDASSQDPIVLEGIINPGQMLGLWIERSIDQTSENFLKRNSCDFLYDMFQKNEKLPTEEEVNLKINFNYAD